jgi:hypothetical protein
MTEKDYALVSLFHPSTAKVNIPLDLVTELTADQATNLVKSVDTLIAAGFTVNLPGLMDGENYEQIGAAVRREKQNDDSTVTTVVDVYPVNGNFRLIGMYLNTADDIKNFETATGLKIDAMPLYDGAPIERGKNTRLDKFIVPVKTAAKLVWKLNPKWEGDNDQRHAKRSFVRWDGLRPANSETNGNGEAHTEQPAPQLTAQPQHAMTLEEAGQTKTPGGADIGKLDDAKLLTLSTSTAPNVTPVMRTAAGMILQHNLELKAKAGAGVPNAVPAM